jgi:hypothetical protein
MEILEYRMTIFGMGSHWEVVMEWDHNVHQGLQQEVTHPESVSLFGQNSSLKFINKTTMCSLDCICLRVPINNYFGGVGIAHEVSINIIFCENLTEVGHGARIKSLSCYLGVENINDGSKDKHIFERCFLIMTCLIWCFGDTMIEKTAKKPYTIIICKAPFIILVISTL